MSIVLDGTAGVTFPNSTTQAAAAAPGGSTTQLQYNNAGAFGGISGVTTDGTRMTASTTIGVGAATPSTSGSGITFPATQSASSNANTLDDYEEGSFTPTITGDGFTRTYNSTYTQGRYTKIGRSVTIEVAMYVPTQTGTYNGQAPEFNLPFPSSSFVPAQHWSLTVLRLATVPAAMLTQVPVLNAMSDTVSLRGYLSRVASATSTSNAWDMTTMGADYQIGYTLTYITST